MQWGMQYTVGTQHAVGTQYTVGTQYAVGVSAKRSTHTVYFFAPTPTAYCIPHCVGFDLFALKVMVPTTHIC